MNSDQEKIAWIQLIRSENIGPATFRDLLKFHTTAIKALEALPEMAQRGGKKKISICPQDVAEKEYEKTLAMGGDIILSNQPEYSSLLREISDFPPVLSVIGNKDLLNKSSVAIVGTRNATINGKQLTRKFAHDLASKDYVVTSGMALGIDRQAHEGALMANGGGTIAVIGCGLDVCYPSENQDIYDKIKEQGLIVSEFPLGSSPQSMNFPRRNRIVSGLSLGTVVIEAQLRSGSLITARMALEQNREVFAVPGSPLDAKGSGPNSLIKQGAMLVESAGDIINGLRRRDEFILCEESSPIQTPDFSMHRTENIDDARKIVLENLSTNSITIDNIIIETGLPYAVISIILLELELAGKLDRQTNGCVSLIMG